MALGAGHFEVIVAAVGGAFRLLAAHSVRGLVLRAPGEPRARVDCICLRMRCDGHDENTVGERVSAFVSYYERDRDVLKAPSLRGIMRTRSVCAASLVVLFCGCGGNLVGPNDIAMPANGLLVSLAIPGPCLVGGCDPANSESTHLGLITLTNTGSEKVFVPLCGPLPAMGTQQFVDGKWVNVGPAVLCAAGPPSMAIAPHDSLRFNQFFAIGVWRLGLGAATDTALVDEALSQSAAVVVR